MRNISVQMPFGIFVKSICFSDMFEGTILKRSGISREIELMKTRAVTIPDLADFIFNPLYWNCLHIFIECTESF